MLLLVLMASLCAHQWKYKEKYEREKDKYTPVLDTPEREVHKRSKLISDVGLPPWPLDMHCTVWITTNL